MYRTADKTAQTSCDEQFLSHNTIFCACTGFVAKSETIVDCTVSGHKYFMIFRIPIDLRVFLKVYCLIFCEFKNEVIMMELT